MDYDGYFLEILFQYPEIGRCYKFIFNRRCLRSRPKRRRLKMNLYFANESRDTRKSFTLFIIVKLNTKLFIGHRNRPDIEF